MNEVRAVDTDNIEDVFVGQLMSSGTVSVAPDAPVTDAAQRLRDHRIGALVVLDEHGHLLGVLTSTDFVGIVAESVPTAEAVVQRYMTETVVSVGAQEPVQTAADRMVTYGIRHLPVVDDENRAIGMLSSTDLAAYVSGGVELTRD